MRRCWIAVLLALAGCRSGQGASNDGSAVVVDVDAVDSPGDGSTDGVAAQPFRALLFSRTVGFRHASIPAALQALTELQSDGGFVVEATEDPTQFTADNLARFRVVVFLMTTGDVPGGTGGQRRRRGRQPPCDGGPGLALVARR